MNPYESPTQPSRSPAASSADVGVREGWLIRASLFLAFFLEAPVCGADPSGMALATQNVQLYVGGKAVCLALILFPLWRYLSVNGRPGVIAAKGSIVSIGVLVIGRLVLELGAWGYYFLHKYHSG